MRRLCGLLVVAFAALALSGGSPAATADPQVTVRYQGSLDTSWEPIMKLPDGRNFHEAHYEWSLVWRGRLGQLVTSPTQPLIVQRLVGSVRYVDRTSAEHADCTGSYRAKVDEITMTASVNEGQNFIGFFVRVPVSSEFLAPTNTTSLHEFCSEVVRWVIPGNDLAPYFQIDLRKGGTQRHDVRIPPQGVNRESGDLRQSLTVVIGKPGAAPTVDPKAAARADLRRALERAKGPCIQLAISAGVMTTGAVWAAVSAPVPGGIPSGSAVIATGTVMANAIAPLCADLIKEIVADYSIVKRDPPLPQAVSAHVASCARWQGKVRAYCEQLSTAAAQLVAAERAVVPILTRLQSAATKLAAARRAGDAKAVEAHERKVGALAESLSSARAAAAAAGKRVAGIVEGAGVHGTLSTAESAATMDALLARLARLGVPAADLRSLAPAAFGPRPIDVLAALAAG